MTLSTQIQMYLKSLGVFFPKKWANISWLKETGAGFHSCATTGVEYIYLANQNLSLPICKTGVVTIRYCAKHRGTKFRDMSFTELALRTGPAYNRAHHELSELVRALIQPSNSALKCSEHGRRKWR